MSDCDIFAHAKKIPPSGFGDIVEKIVKNQVFVEKLKDLLVDGETIHAIIILQHTGCTSILLLTNLSNIFNTEYIGGFYGPIDPTFNINTFRKKNLLDYDDAQRVNSVLITICDGWILGPVSSIHYSPGSHQIEDIGQYMKAIDEIFNKDTRDKRILNMLKQKSSVFHDKSSFPRISDISSDDREIIEKESKLSLERIELDRQIIQNKINHGKKMQDLKSKNIELIRELNALEVEYFELQMQRHVLSEDIKKEDHQNNIIKTKEAELHAQLKQHTDLSDKITQKIITHNDNLITIADLQEQIKQMETIAKMKHIDLQKKEARLRILSNKLKTDIDNLEYITNKKVGLTVSEIVDPQFEEV